MTTKTASRDLSSHENHLREIVKNKVIGHITHNLENTHEILEDAKEYTNTEIKEYIKNHKKMIQDCVDECIESIVEYYAEGNPEQFFENLTEEYIYEQLDTYIDECIECSMSEDAWE
jgi:hypothetical protein